MTVLDTSVLIRFFTGDDELKARKVMKLLDSDEELLLIDVVMLELVFTLLKFYKLSKVQLIEVIKYLVSKPNVKIGKKMKEALMLFGKSNLSVTDSMVVVCGRGNKVASFDEDLVKMKSVNSVW